MNRQRNRSGRSGARRRRPPLRPRLIQLPTARRGALEPLEARLLLAGDLWPTNDKVENAVETELQTRELSILPAASEAETTNGDTFALFDSLPSAFFYKNTMGPGVADGITQFGPAAAAWVPLAGDWDADGADSFGLYDASNGVFFLKNTIGPGAAETIVQFGPAGQGWIPLVGDWDGDGTSTVGLLEPTTSSFFLKNTNAAGPADVVFQFGPANADWVPVAGDWDGDGNDSVALYSGSGFFQKNTFAPGAADAVFSFGPDNADWVPLAGDWDADGTDTVALFESSNSVFFFKNTNAAGPGDGTVQFGPAGANWTPLVGDWDGTITTAPTEVHLTVPDLLTLDVASIEYFDPSTVGPGEPVASLREAVLSFTDLPGELVGLTSVALDALDGYDDDGDGLIDGFGLSTSIALGEIELAVGDATLLALAGVTLGVNGLQVRPQLNDGFRTGELVFDAQGVELLPDGLSGVFGLQADEPLAIPGIGSIDINSGAFELGFDIPAAVSQSLTLSGWVPLRLSRFDAAWDPGDSSPMLDFALGGFVAADQLAARLGSALGSPNLAVTVRRYDEQSTSFVELSDTNPLTVGVTYASDELRPTNTPALKVDLENLEFDLGGSVGSLTLDGYLAVGGFDGVGLPELMPSELGPPFADQQLAGLLTVVSASSLGQASGTITLGGTLDSADGVSQLSLSGVAQLAVEVALPGVTTSSEFEANFQWTLDVDHTTGTPTFSGLPTLNSIAAQNVHVAVSDLLTLDVASIEYFDPATVGPGEPVASLREAVLSFTDLPGELVGLTSVALDALDGYDDDGDGLIDGFGLSTSIALGDIELAVGDATLLALAGVTLGVNGLQVRPQLNDGFRTGELVFDAQGVELLPDGLSGVFGLQADEPLAIPGIGSIDINSGAFELGFDIPAAVSQSLTLSGWVPFRLTRFDAAWDPGDSSPLLDFALGGFVAADQLASRLGSALGSPNLAVTVRRYDEQSTSFVELSATNPLTVGVTYTSGELRPTNTPALKVDLENLEFDLGGSVGSLTLSGYLAVGGFDGVGLPELMPSELGPPFADQQLAGLLTVVSASSLGQASGTITLGGTLDSADGISQLSLSGVAQLAVEVALPGVTTSSEFEANFQWTLDVDHTTGTPSFSGLPTLSSIAAQNVHVSVSDLFTLDVGSIEYLDPSTVGPGEPVASLREAVLSFTDLPGELVGLTSVALDALDGYDDDGDGLIDGFGLSTSIALGEIELAVGDATLLALAGVTLGVNGLQVRPQLNDGFRTGELVFDAQGVELLPDGLSGVFGLQADEPLAVPGIGSIDINSGAFELGFDIPAAVSQSLTLSGWVPFRLTRFDAAWDPGDSSPLLDFALGGFVAADQLAARLGSALGSPNLAVTVRRYDENSTSFVELSATNPLTVGVTYTSGELRPTNTPALKVDLENLEFDLGGSVGSLTLSGYLAVGGFDGLGLPELMPSELGPPFADQQLAGLLTVVSASSLGQASGTITLGGTLDSADGVSQLSLSGVAQLAVEVALPGVTTSSEFEANFQWTLDVDHTTGTPTFSGLPTLDSIEATNLSFVVENVVRFDIGQIDYLSSPAPGSPVAIASGATITLLGALAGANVAGSADLSLFDDDGDGSIDGVSLDEVQLSLAAGQTWDYPAGPMPLLRASDLTATLSGLTYRPVLTEFESQGQIELALGQVTLYPEGGGPFDATVLDTTGTIDVVTGELFIALGELTIGLGPDSLFEVEVLNAGFRLDADEATDILTVSSATLRMLDAVGSLDAASFSIANFRFNLVEGLVRFGLDSVLLNTPQGLLGTLGLAGFLPLDVTQAGLTFADDGQGYTDFTDFVLSLDGYFDLSLLEAALPFDPTLSIGDVPAGTIDTPHTFTGIEFGFDIAAGRITPINLANLKLGFSNWQIGELVFAGELVAAGYVDGALQPSITGHIGIDVAAADNKVQPGGGTGVDLYGAEIALTGTIQQSAGLTSLVVDAQAGLSFDLRLGDFLRLSDLGFNFGLNIEVADNFLDDPPALIDVSPRLESMSVGTLTASLGDYISLGAVPGSGGEPGLMIDFDPAANEPLAVFNFNVQSPLIGLSGTIEGLAILQGGVPDFDSLDQIDIALVERGDGSPSLLQDFFSEFMPLNISRIALAFQDGFFEFEGPTGAETIVGIADPTKLNLITSGQAGLPDWLPEGFAFEVGGEFSNLELDLAKLVNGEFAIVNLGGLGFEAGVDFEAFKIFGALTIGSVDADPGPGEETIFYAAIAGALEIAGYGAEGALVLTTAGPIGATLSVPLAIPIAQTGFLITGAAGSIQFGTVLLPEPEDIQRPADLGQIPNPFDIQLSSVQFIENLVQSLWVTADGGYVRPTWTEPVTLALQGQLTHVAVAKLLTGTVTVAANLTLPVGGATVDDAGLALLGFGDIRAFDIPFVDAKVVFDLRDELNPSLGFYIQAPSTGNPLGILFPAQADFGALLRTDGLAMATAVGLRAFFTQLADGVLSQGQVFFENVAGQILDILQSDADESALAELVEPLLPAGQTFLDLSTQDFIVLLRDVLELDDVLDQLAAGGGQTIEQLTPTLQDKLSAVLALSNAIMQDVLRFGPRVIEAGLDDALTTGEQLVALGLRNPGQENDPLDPFELLANFDPENLAAERVIPIELVSEFTAVLIDALGSAAFEAFAQTAAFVASDSFDPRLLIEGALQPTLLGIPVGDPPGSVQLTVSKRGVSFGLDASIIRMLKLIGGAPLGPLALLMNAAPDVTDQTTIAYELPFNSTEILQSLAAGELSLAALNPFSPDWGQLVASQIHAIAADFAVSIVQFGPGSTLLENNVQIVDDFDDPVDPGKIPVTSQALLDRMRSLGGFLFTGGSLQAKLLTDPFEVILNLLDAARQAGEELETADDEFQYLAQLFSTVPSFLEAVQDSLQEMEEFARVQAYLPISYATLLPQEIQDLLDGDVEAFNEAFLDLFFDANGNIRDEAVLDVLDQLGAQIQDSASTIAANMFYEGVLNSKLLGIELANGRIFGGVLPDPDNPGQTLDYGNSAITVTGTIPWLGGLQVEAVLDKQSLALPPAPTSGPDPLAPLRAFYGDAVPLPRGRVELALDTTAPPGGTSDFELVLDSLGLDGSLFQLPEVGRAEASLRAFTPGYDLTSNDPIERVGGLEFLANLSIRKVVDSAAFSVRMAPPVAGPGGTYLPFTGRASADEITLGGLTISNAKFELISDADGLRIGIKGEADLLGAMFTVDGELDSQFRGNLSLTLQSGETLAGAFGGFSGSGSFTLMLNGPTDGSIAFVGSLNNLPGTGGGSLNVAGEIEANGDFDLASSTTSLSFAGFTINTASLRVTRQAQAVEVHVEGNGTTSLLGATFRIGGSLSSSGAGTLDMSLAAGLPSFGGLSGNGSFNLVLSSAASGSVSFNGTLSGVPGKGGSSLSMSGSVFSSGNFSVNSSATGLSLGGFSINSAVVTVARSGSTTSVSFSGNASLSLLGASFRVSGSLSTSGNGTLTLTQLIGTPSFGGLSGSGTFNLVLSSASSGSVSFSGTLSGVPGKGGSSLSMSGSIFSSGNFSVESSATGLSLGGFSINSAVVTVARSFGTTTVTYSGNSSLSLLGATFRVSGSLSTSGNGTLTLTQLIGTPSFSGLSGSGTFNLVLSSASSGSVSFSGTLSGVPGKGGSSLSMSGSIFSSGNFSVNSSATGLSLGGFSISSAVVTVARSGSTTSVSFSGNSSLSLLGATFRMSGSLSTSGNGTLTLTQTSGTPSFGGLSGSGTFNLVLSSASSGSVSFNGTLSGVPGKGSSSLSMSGSIFSSGNFSLNSSATGLSLGGFSISSAVVTVARTGSTTSVSFSGSSSLSLLGATFRVSGSVDTSGNGTLSLTQTSGTPSFGGLSGSGTFSLVLSSASSGSVSFSGTLSGVPGRGSSSLSMSGSIFSSGNFSVSSSATSLSLGGFSISSAVVTVARSGSTTSVSYSGNSSLSLLGATFRVSGSVDTSGNGTLSLTQTSGTPSFGGLSASGTFNLVLSSASSGSVSFSGTLSGVPGKGSTALSMSGSIFSSGNFSVSSSATSLSLGGFSISSAVVTVARSGSTTSVAYSGNSSLSLLGATFRVSGSLSTSGNGTLSLALISGTPKFAGAEASGTFELSVSNATSGSISFDGSVSNIPGGFVSSLDVDGTISSSTSYSVSGSTSVTQSISIIGQPLARIRGTFNLTLASSGFSASITGATIEIRVFDPFSGQFVWQTLVQGTATINSDGTGSLGGFNFTY